MRRKFAQESNGDIDSTRAKRIHTSSQHCPLPPSLSNPIDMSASVRKPMVSSGYITESRPDPATDPLELTICVLVRGEISLRVFQTWKTQFALKVRSVHTNPAESDPDAPPVKILNQSTPTTVVTKSFESKYADNASVLVLSKSCTRDAFFSWSHGLLPNSDPKHGLPLSLWSRVHESVDKSSETTASASASVPASVDCQSCARSLAVVTGQWLIDCLKHRVLLSPFLTKYAHSLQAELVPPPGLAPSPLLPPLPPQLSDAPHRTVLQLCKTPAARSPDATNTAHNTAQQLIDRTRETATSASVAETKPDRPDNCFVTDVTEAAAPCTTGGKSLSAAVLGYPILPSMDTVHTPLKNAVEFNAPMTHAAPTSNSPVPAQPHPAAKFAFMQGGSGAAATQRNENAHITDILEELQGIYERAGDEWRSQGYKKCIGQLKQQPKITSAAQLEGLRCVGKSMRDKIVEIIETSSLQKLSYLQGNTRVQAIAEMVDVWGIGPSTAQKLYNQGFRSVRDLRRRGQHLLNRQQLVGLQYYEELLVKIPRAEVEEIAEVVRYSCAQIAPTAECIVCGSYRRGKAQSGDVDVLIVPPAGMEQLPPTTLPLLLHRLEQQGFLTDHLALPTGYHSLLKQALLLQEEEEQKEEKEQGNNQEQDLKEKREYIGQHLHGSTNDKNCALNVPVESDSVRENSLHLCGGDSVASSEVAPYMASGDIARDTEVTEAGSTSGTAGGFATWLQRTGVDSTLIRGSSNSSSQQIRSEIGSTANIVNAACQREDGPQSIGAIKISREDSTDRDIVPYPYAGVRAESLGGVGSTDRDIVPYPYAGVRAESLGGVGSMEEIGSEEEGSGCSGAQQQIWRKARLSSHSGVRSNRNSYMGVCILPPTGSSESCCSIQSIGDGNCYREPNDATIATAASCTANNTAVRGRNVDSSITTAGIGPGSTSGTGSSSGSGSSPPVGETLQDQWRQNQEGCSLNTRAGPGEGTGRVHRRIDIKVYPRSLKPFALLYFTGSDHFNRSMRCYAGTLGYTLHDKGLLRCVRDSRGHIQMTLENSCVPCETEEDIFAALGLPYKEPCERNVFDGPYSK